MKKIICVGSLNVDMIIYVNEFCKDNDEVVIKEFNIFSGGQAGNIASGLGVLDKESYFFGNIGDDAHTSMLIKDFDDCNVNYSFAKRTKNPNNFVCCLVNKEGSRQLYAYNYVDLSFGDFSEELYRDTSFIIFTSLIKEDIIDLYVSLAKKAKEKGIKIALDPGSIFAKLGLEKLKPLLELCDYFFPNINEVNLLVDNISKLTELVPNVIVKYGEKGTKYFKGKNIKEFTIKKIDNVVDTTGAGDCFVAAFIALLVDGKNEEEAINFANHAATLSVMKKGARSMPKIEEIEVFMNE